MSLLYYCRTCYAENDGIIQHEQEVVAVAVIAGHGGYVPLYRIDRADIAEQHGGRGRGETAVPGRDENHVTMASEAAETAIDRSGTDPEELGAVVSASITDPFAEHGIAAHVAYRLGATGDVRTGDFRASGRAATDALAFAAEYADATDAPALLVAADIMPVEEGHDDEAHSGSGAGALVIAPDGSSSVASIEALGAETSGFVERHRLHGEAAVPGDGSFEGDDGFGAAVEAATTRALSDAGIDSPDRAVIAAHDARMASGAASGFSDATHDSTFDQVGYAGAATFALDLVSALENADAGETAIAVAYGPGGADAIALEIEEPTSQEGLSIAELLDSKEYVTYAKHLEYRERVDYQGVTVA